MIRKPQRSFGLRVGPDTEFTVNAVTMWAVITMLLGGTVFCTRFYFQTMDDHQRITAIDAKMDASIDSTRQIRDAVRDLELKLEIKGLITSRMVPKGHIP